MFEGLSLEVRLVIFISLVGITALSIGSKRLYKIVIASTYRLVNQSRILSGHIAAIYDLLIPINSEDGSFPRTHLIILCVANLLTVAASVLVAIAHPHGTASIILAVLNFLLTFLNLLFCMGAYWALREGFSIMNGDLAYRRRRFADLSTAKNLTVIAAVGLILVLQLAAMMFWLQSVAGVGLISATSQWGGTYASFVVAVISTIPIISLYVKIPGLVSQSMFLPGAGSACYILLNIIGSIIVISTIIGFVHQRMVLRGIISSLLVRTNDSIVPLLRNRFLRAPSTIKSYVLEALNDAVDNNRRIKLIQLAADRHTFTLPAFFFRRYARFSPEVKYQGSLIIEKFVSGKIHRFDRKTLVAILQRAAKVPTNHREDAQNIAKIAIPVLYRLIDNKFYGISEITEVQELLKGTSLQHIVGSLLHANQRDDVRLQATKLLFFSECMDSLPEILRCLQYMAPDTQIIATTGIRDMLKNHNIKSQDSRGKDVLGIMVKTIDWNILSNKASQDVHPVLKDCRTEIILRQKVASYKLVPSSHAAATAV